MSRAVVSLLNTPAGKFPWYEEFPQRISAALATRGIDHIVGYKYYTPSSSAPAEARLEVHDVQVAPHRRLLASVLGPILARFDRVILHTHSYSFGQSQFGHLVRSHPDATWWATLHRTPAPGSQWSRYLRQVRMKFGATYPDRIYGCSETATAAARTLFPAKIVRPLVNGRLDAAGLARFEPRGEPRTAILVGRMVRGKGVLEAMQATRLIVAEEPMFRLLVVGDGADLGEMRCLAASLGLGAAVYFAGHQEKLDDWYAQADLIWIPTRPDLLSEGLGLTAIEAQGHALPAIYSASGGLPETQVNGETGLLVNPLTPENIAAATLRLIRTPTEYHRMRDLIRGHRQRWGIERMITDYVNEYVCQFES